MNIGSIESNQFELARDRDVYMPADRSAGAGLGRFNGELREIQHPRRKRELFGRSRRVVRGL
jgi:hypothetical protein